VAHRGVNKGEDRMDKADLVRVNKLKLGMLLKALREEQQTTQRDAALQAGYAKSTFVCNVEKGMSSMPIDKIWDFAQAYGKGDANNLALAIIRLVYPDMWDLCARIFGKGYGSRTKPETLAGVIDEWTEAQFQKYTIEL
jgi:DNA-binding XRE family transcriptional regulator